MAGRIFLANVGINASHRFTSPVFPDRSFEFIPIPEDRVLPGPYAVRYQDLKSYKKPGYNLKDYIPRRLWDWPVHNDPEFDTFTYGDNCETSPRAAGLKRLESGDYLFFIARLKEREYPGPGDLSQANSTGRYGFYLVGYLEIEETVVNVTARPAPAVYKRIAANAHVRRGMSDPALWDGFWVFRGSHRSRRFERAVPVTRELVGRVFRSADGSPWRWDNGRTDLQVMGSYTRSCRCIIDPDKPGHAPKQEALWNWVERHSK